MRHQMRILDPVAVTPIQGMNYGVKFYHIFTILLQEFHYRDMKYWMLFWIDSNDPKATMLWTTPYATRH
jgi:hypothetical protein